MSSAALRLIGIRSDAFNFCDHSFAFMYVTYALDFADIFNFIKVFPRHIDNFIKYNKVPYETIVSVNFFFISNWFSVVIHKIILRVLCICE